jgi:hypothetical protein
VPFQAIRDEPPQDLGHREPACRRQFDNLILGRAWQAKGDAAIVMLVIQLAFLQRLSFIYLGSELLEPSSQEDACSLIGALP